MFMCTPFDIDAYNIQLFFVFDIIMPMPTTELDIDSLTTLPKLHAGRTHLLSILNGPFKSVDDINTNITTIKKIKRLHKKNNTSAIFSELIQDESMLVSMNGLATTQHGYYSQLMWDKDSKFATLNTFPWITEFIHLFRCILLPVYSH
jgi:hypothetical protein